MPDISKQNGIEMADISKINEQDIPSGGGGTATTTPTITSLSTTGYGTVSFTIGNFAGYTNPVFQVVVVDSASATKVDQEVVTTDGDITISVPMDAAAGTATLKVRAQQFGDFIQSAEATTTFTQNSLNFRYYRVRTVTSSGANSANHMGIRDWRFYDAVNFGGTPYPSAMTSDSLPSPYVASAGNTYGTYNPYKAFDNDISSSMYWSIFASAANGWLQIDMGSSPTTMKSARIKFYGSSNVTHITLTASNTGSFSGEETTLLDSIEVSKSGEPYNTLF